MATLLGLDAGTTAATAVLYDENLSVLAHASREVPLSTPRPGWVEHDAEGIALSALAVAEEACAAHGPPDAIGITNQRETVVAWDAETHSPLCPAIVWQCRRTADRCSELREEGHEDLIRRATGLVVDPYFSATKMEWLLANDEAVAGAAAAGRLRLGTVDAWVAASLTGGTWATDPSNASRTMLYDIGTGAWSEDLCELFGVDRSWLPEVRPSAGDYGVTADGVLGGGVPITGMIGDQQAALFGQGCHSRGEVKCTIGTGSFLLVNAGEERPEDVPGLLTTIGAAADGSACYALEGAVFISGAAVQWIRDGLGLIEEARGIEALALSVEDSCGVTFVPAFAGLGAPYWDSGARGALLGLTRGAGPGHIARATLEAMAHQDRELIELFDAGLGGADEIVQVRMDGGGARNDLLMQIHADFFGRPVVRAADVDATARGAAWLAGIGAGIEVTPGQAGEDRFEPQMPATDRESAARGWREAVGRVLTRDSTT